MAAERQHIRVSASPEWRALTRGLGLLESSGLRTPCQTGPKLACSEDAGDRARAARACTRCPLLAICDDFAEANGEVTGVWGGRDRTVSDSTLARRARARRQASA